jgi:FkbM family methyltransferase
MKIKQHLEENKENYKQWIEMNDQGRIELKILPYLADIENGVFVEAGAHDGLFQSNTKILEELGWSGLLVEPSPSSYELCKKNRTCIIENCALVPFTYDKDTIVGNFDGTPRASVVGNRFSVDAKTLSSLLEKHSISHVDILCLDVEGYEMEVLKGIHFDRVSFTYILIEVNSHVYSLEELEKFMKSKGFENIANISNFRFDNTPGWPGNHQDYLFKKI